MNKPKRKTSKLNKLNWWSTETSTDVIFPRKIAQLWKTLSRQVNLFPLFTLKISETFTSVPQTSSLNSISPSYSPSDICIPPFHPSALHFILQPHHLSIILPITIRIPSFSSKGQNEAIQTWNPSFVFISSSSAAGPNRPKCPLENAEIVEEKTRERQGPHHDVECLGSSALTSTEQPLVYPSAPILGFAEINVSNLHDPFDEYPGFIYIILK